MAKEVLKVKKLLKDAEIPEYVLSNVGFDLISSEDTVLKPMEQKTVKTGIAIEIPQGHVGLIRDRIGIVTKMGVHTAAGTFDPSYRGEISVVLVNFGDDEVEIEKGMRIAQMLIVPVVRVEIKQVKELSDSSRMRPGVTGTKQILKNLLGIKGKKIDFE